MSIYNIIHNLITSYRKDNSLDTRMRTNLRKYNSVKCHGFKPFVITLKSKELLSYINYVVSFRDKVDELNNIADIMFEVSKQIYRRYDPHVIYTFENELNIVFYYNENGIYSFDGNIHKTITSLCSFTSVEMAKHLMTKDINLDAYFTGEFVEFDTDYEVLNYLVWRQMDCKRNTITLLYKCLDLTVNVEGVTINNMISAIDKKMEMGIENGLKNLLTGSTIKKYLFYKLCNKTGTEEVVSRKSVGIEYVTFSENFKENLQKYIVNKLY